MTAPPGARSLLPGVSRPDATPAGPQPGGSAGEPAPSYDLDEPAARSGTRTSNHPPSISPRASQVRAARASIPMSDDPVRDALVSTRRYGATLNGLLSAVDNFARGVEAARTANDALSRKLETLQELLTTNERETQARCSELERRVQYLEQKLRSQRKAFEEERRFLTEDQDEFLRALLDEHDEQLAALRKERDDALAAARAAVEAPPTLTPPRPAGSEPDERDARIAALRREIETLRSERESSRALVERMRVQRDRAQAGLRRLSSRTPSEACDNAHPTTPAPPPFAPGAALRVPPAPRAPLELAKGLPGAPVELGGLELDPPLSDSSRKDDSSSTS